MSLTALPRPVRLLNTAFAALGIIGVGASELIYYPYWCLEKGYAARVGPRDEAGWGFAIRDDALSPL